MSHRNKVDVMLRFMRGSDSMNIGDRIKELRVQKGLTQLDLAKTLELSNVAISKWETGVSKPDIQYLIPLSRVLGTSVDDLLSDQKKCSYSEIEAISREIFKLCQDNLMEEAYEISKEYMSEYKGDIDLKLNLLTILLSSIFGSSDDVARRIVEDYETCLKSTNGDTLSGASHIIVRYYISVKDIEKAEFYLAKITGDSNLYSQLKAEIFELQEDYELAYRTYEEILYSSSMMIQQVLEKLKRLANIDHDEDAFEYYIQKQIIANKLFESSDFQNYANQYELDGKTSVEELKRLLDSIPTMTSFTDARLYSHMKFKEDSSSYLQELVYKDILEYLNENEFEELDEREVQSLRDKIERQLNL